MTLWKHSTMDTFWSDEHDFCEVRITGLEIVVSYKGDPHPVIYKGQEVGPGHFELKASNGGTATLHRSPDDEWLEGFWIEGGEEGMWRIRLVE